MMFDLNPLELFGALVVAHMLCDYPLQGDFLAKAKNHTAPIPGVPWWQALGAHSIIHGGAVWLLTGIWWFGFAETVAHALIDNSKCAKRYGLTTDQALHIAFKAVWVAFCMPPESGAWVLAALFGGPFIIVTFWMGLPGDGEKERVA